MKNILVLFASCLFWGLTGKAQCAINIQIDLFPDTVCSNDTVKLSASVGTTGVNFNWSGPGGSLGTGQNVFINNATLTHSGTYRVVGSKTGCPSDTDSIVLVVHARPVTPVVTSNAPLCISDTLKLSVTPGSTSKILVWGPSSFTDTVYQPAIPNAGKNNSGQYYALVTDTFGCVSDTGKHSISYYAINTRPDTAIATGNGPICKDDTLKLFGNPTAIAGQKYNWYGPNQQYYNTQNVVAYNYSILGKQTFVFSIDSAGCYSVPDTVEIEVRPNTPPKVTVSANPGYFVGIYTTVTLTANTSDTGITTSYQWRKNGGDILGATGKTYTFQVGTDVQPGEFISVRIQTGPTCATIDTALSGLSTFTINTGINEPDHSKLQLYPNPVSKYLAVRGMQGDDHIVLFTVTGISIEAVKKRMPDGSILICTESLQPGVYIIRSGNLSERFIKL